MEIGAVFPHQEIGDDPSAIRDWAQTVEGLGYSHILAYDHVIGAVHEGREPKLWGPYTEQDAFHEVFVLFGYFAACTSRVGLATGVLILPQRQTVLVAKQAAQIAVLSGGRLRLGVGTGWNYVEYDSLNQNFKNRGRRQEEQVELLRKLWTQEVVSHQSRFHQVERAGLKPLPPHPIPIWFGGFTPAAFQRAARIGDGFIFGDSQRRNLAGLSELRTALTSAGRDPAAFGIEALLNYQSGPDRWRTDLQAWIAEGANYVAMRTSFPPGQDTAPDTPKAQLEALEKYWAVVGDLAD